MPGIPSVTTNGTKLRSFVVLRSTASSCSSRQHRFLASSSLSSTKSLQSRLYWQRSSMKTWSLTSTFSHGQWKIFTMKVVTGSDYFFSNFRIFLIVKPAIKAEPGIHNIFLAGWASDHFSTYGDGSASNSGFPKKKIRSLKTQLSKSCR